jgi:hypothetical protein
MAQTKNYFKSNLLLALDIAITDQRKNEKKIGYTRDSGLVAGWVELIEYLEENLDNQINLI